MQELQLCWIGDFEKLKLFVNENVDFVGVWSSPGSDKKKYSDGNSSISWRKSKKVLEIQGRDRSVITAKLCSVLCNVDSVQSSEVSCAKRDRNGASPPTSNELSVEVEGVKLDLTIAEKAICDNKYSIKNIEESLHEVIGKFDNIGQQLEIFGTEMHTVKNQHMIQYSSKAVEDLNLDRQNSHALGKCCHENNSNTTANSSINANRNDTGNDVNIFVSNLTPKTIGLSIPSKNWNNWDKQNILGVEAIEQSTLADNYSPVVNIKSRPTVGKTSRQTVTENSNVKVLSTTIRNASNKVPIDSLNLTGKRSHTKHLNARGNYIQINKVDAQTRVSEGIQRSELSVPEVTHLGNWKSNDKQHAIYIHLIRL